jgi:hypothetical protein
MPLIMRSGVTRPLTVLPHNKHYIKWHSPCRGAPHSMSLLFNQIFGYFKTLWLNYRLPLH